MLFISLLIIHERIICNYKTKKKIFKKLNWKKMCLFTCLFTFSRRFEHGKHINTTLCIYFYSVMTLGCIHSMNEKKIK